MTVLLVDNNLFLVLQGQCLNLMVIRSAFLTNTKTLSPLADCSDQSGIVHKSVVLLNCWRHKSGNGDSRPTFAVARCPGSRIQPDWDPCRLATDRWSRASRLAKDIASIAQLRVPVIRTIYLHSGIDKNQLGTSHQMKCLRTPLMKK